ncbi:hypothetical protein MUX61_13580 [Listeria monocytogenes]|nr:hypothetical protein [Listeria monocytogenes]MCL1258424.1 hypothetical protein [Listeria monocytogenes]MCL1272740.1 hypothetical protein [Listeria monocytogenes]MCL1283884.1 hypothetical protein [Listeria monocytogenes]MCL1287021.1 hypothetical protein [Listeria monocytogenes]
MSYFRHTERQN